MIYFSKTHLHFLPFKCIHEILMSRQPKLCPKSQIPGFSEGVPELGTVVPLSGFEASQAPADAKRHHRIFRVKRKHVLKACDRCRVKKTKVCSFLMLAPICSVLFPSHPRNRPAEFSMPVSVMVTSPVIAVQHTIIHVSSARERPRRLRSIREGENPSPRTKQNR